MLGEFAKYAFCGLKRKRREFECSVLKYVSIKIPALTRSGRESLVCVNQPDRLTQPLICVRCYLFPNFPYFPVYTAPEVGLSLTTIFESPLIWGSSLPQSQMAIFSLVGFSSPSISFRYV